MGIHRIAVGGIGVAFLAAGISIVGPAAANPQRAAAATSPPPPTVVVTGVPTPAPAPGDETNGGSGDPGEGLFASPTQPNPASPDMGPLEPPVSTTSVRPPTAAGLDATASSTIAPAPLPRLLADGAAGGRTAPVAAVDAAPASAVSPTLPTTGPGGAGTAGLALVAAGVAIVAAAGRRDLRRPASDDQAAAT